MGQWWPAGGLGAVRREVPISFGGSTPGGAGLPAAGPLGPAGGALRDGGRTRAHGGRGPVSAGDPAGAGAKGNSPVILSGRRINDDMGKYVAENCVKKLIAADKHIKGAKVAILGFTFKENCPDTRNSKIIDVVNELKEYGIEPFIADPEADRDEAKRLYGIAFMNIDTIRNIDAVILAVAHKEFIGLKMNDMDSMFGAGKKVLLDIKGIFNRQEYEAAGYEYWRL